MKVFDYRRIYQKITKNFSSKTKEILSRRFGIGKEKPETLESIGKSFGITRERVRQIQEWAFLVIKKENKEILQEIFDNFKEAFLSWGELKRNDLALSFLGKGRFEREANFFLTLGDPFFRYYEKQKYFSFWAIKKFSSSEIEERLEILKNELENIKEKKDPKEVLNGISFEEFFGFVFPKHRIERPTLTSLVEISKEIKDPSDGYLGLKYWPEINPRGVKDKAYLVLKKEAKPLHFREIAQKIKPSVLLGTLHNELIKDPRFVLIGRGIYALKEWGYIPGTVKDLIYQFLKENPTGLEKEQIIKKILSQRMVDRNTILINLRDKNFYQEDGKYKLKEF